MSPITKLSPPAVLNTSISAVTRGQTLTITPFYVCVPVLKCEGFVNAAILLWQWFYLTDTSRRRSLLWSHQCSPQHSSSQLYLFPQIIDILTWLCGLFVPGNPIFCLPKAYFTCHKHIIKMISRFIIITRENLII